MKLLTLLLIVPAIGMCSIIGPNGIYYITAGYTVPNPCSPPACIGNENFAVQGQNVLYNQPQQNFNNTLGENAIAVRNNDVRTLSEDNFGPGANYDSTLTYTGTDYAAQPFGFYDGAADTSGHNYSVDWNGDANGAFGVYMMNADWSNPTLLFDVPSQSLGITWAPDNTLYIGEFLNSVVDHYNMAGNLLGSFAAGPNGTSALAMDYSDGTLWMGQSGSYDQFTTGGVYLQTVSYPAMATLSTWGGEFSVSATPEPGTLALMVCGIALFVFRKTSRRA